MSVRPRRSEIAAVAAVHFVLAAAVVMLAMHHVPPEPTNSGVADLLANYYPMLRYGFGELRHGHVPLWNPHQACGTPFFAIPQIGLFYPVYLPYLFLPADVALDLDVVLHLTIAGVGMYVLCRRFGLGWAPSLVGGLVYAYHGSAMIDVYFPNFIAAVAWVPLIFLLTDVVLTRRSLRACGGFAAVVGASLLGGNVQFAYLTALALLPLLVGRGLFVLWHDGWRALAAGTGLLALASVLALAVALVRVLPGAEFIARAWRPPGSFNIEMGSIMALRPTELLRDVFSPQDGGPDRPRAWVPGGLRREAYVGIVPLALAVLGVALWRRRSLGVPLAATGVAAAWYALGTHGSLYPLVFALPAGSWFRGPDRALIFFGFAMAALAAAGLDEVLRRARTAGSVAAAVAVAAAGVVALGFLTTKPNGATLLLAYAATGLAALETAVLAGARPMVRRAALGLVALLIAFDLLHAHPHRAAFPSQLRTYFARHAPLFTEIRRRQGLDRTYFWSSRDPDGPLFFHSDLAKAGLNHGVWMATDYETLSLLRFEQYMAGFGAGFPIGYRRFHLTAANVPLMHLMGVRFLLIAEEDEDRFVAPDVRAGWRAVMRHAGVTLYENPAALPRAFVAGRIEVEPNDGRLLERLATADLTAVAFVEAAPAAAPLGDSEGKTGDATIAEYTAHRVAVDVRADRPGLLVLTDQHYPGWRATVDGVAAPVYRTDFLFRGVPVPPGRHRVEFSYRSTRFLAGLAGTVVAVLAIGVLLVRRSPSRRA